MTQEEVKNLLTGEIISYQSKHCGFGQRIGKIIDSNETSVCIAWENLRYKDEYLFGNWYEYSDEKLWRNTSVVKDKSLIDNFNQLIHIYVENIESNLQEFKKKVFFEII